MQQMVCSTHGPAPVSYQWLAPLGGASAMGAFGYRLSEGNPYITLATVLAGLWLGAQASNHCPQCGALLQIVGDVDMFLG